MKVLRWLISWTPFVVPGFRLVIQSFSDHLVQGEKCSQGRLSRIRTEINLSRRPGGSLTGTSRGVALIYFRVFFVHIFFILLSRKKGQFMKDFLHYFIKLMSEVTCT